jgi:DNA helicase-2/ATP-dependent DNA helicase PcrA
MQLMTVHAAKGLEFDAVFITGLEEGLFPHENSDKAEGGVEEERRLMYVAITRARRRLYLSFSQTRMLHGQTRFNIKSRFFDELPEEALKWLSPKVQHHWFASQPRAAWADTPSKHPALASSTELGWRIGQTVFHQKFGEGVIVNIEGGGGNARASINFGPNGMKLLDLTIAKLEKVA